MIVCCEVWIAATVKNKRWSKLVDTLLTGYTAEQIAVISRAAALIISAFAGLFCIYLGWRLYRDANTSSTEGEASTSSLKIKIVAAGPGVFFALFGMWLLTTIVNTEAHISPSSIVFYNGDTIKKKDIVDALNIGITDIASTAINLSSADGIKRTKAIDVLSLLKEQVEDE